MDLKPDDLIGNPWVPGFLGALLGQRALGPAGLMVRLGYLASSWGAATLFGPLLARYLGATGDATAEAAVIGFVGAFGIVIFDSALRWAKSAEAPDLLGRLVNALNALKGAGK
jgi:hypothetical protein